MTAYLLEIKAFEWSLQIYHNIMMKFLYAKNVQQQKYYFLATLFLQLKGVIKMKVVKF